jgi:hypothetical protein
MPPSAQAPCAEEPFARPCPRAIAFPLLGNDRSAVSYQPIDPARRAETVGGQRDVIQGNGLTLPQPAPRPQLAAGQDQQHAQQR